MMIRTCTLIIQGTDILIFIIVMPIIAIPIDKFFIFPYTVVEASGYANSKN